MAYEKHTPEQIEARYADFKNPSNKGHIERLELLRTLIVGTAKDLVELTPVSPEQTRALNALDEVWSLGQLAIFRNEKR